MIVFFGATSWLPTLLMLIVVGVVGLLAPAPAFRATALVGFPCSPLSMGQPLPPRRADRRRRLMASATRQRLMDGAVEVIRRHGISATSARTIAASAGVHQG